MIGNGNFAFGNELPECCSALPLPPSVFSLEAEMDGPPRSGSDPPTMQPRRPPPLPPFLKVSEKFNFAGRVGLFKEPRKTPPIFR